MPRINLVKPSRSTLLTRMINSKLSMIGMKKKDFAQRLNLSTATMWYKLNKGSLLYTEFVEISKLLEFDAKDLEVLFK